MLKKIKNEKKITKAQQQTELKPKAIQHNAQL